MLRRRQLSLSYNCQRTLEFEDELRQSLGYQRYLRLSFVWVSATGERYVSWDRVRDEGAGIWFGASLTVADIVSQLIALLG